MPEFSKDEREELKRLRERVDHLENINKQYISTLDMLNSLGDIHGSVELKRTPEHIFTSTRQYLHRLIDFDVTAFMLIDEDDNSFEIKECVPQSRCDNIENLIDELIEQGEFGWALNQNRICEPQTKAQGRRVLMHVLASRTRIRGMFIGIVNEKEPTPSIMTLGLVSAILYNSAYALESAILYKMVTEYNESLEEQIAIRTSELRKTQDDLKQANDDLEVRVLERTEELSRVNKKLRLENEIRKQAESELLKSEQELIQARKIAEEANRAKSDFLSKMSHELRTPLNAILGFSQIMELDEYIMSSPNSQSVQEIHRAGEHLLELINEILDLSKIEAGKIDVNMKHISAYSVLTECNSLISSLAKQRKISVHGIDKSLEDIYLFADKTLLKQVFINLLSNSVKYNHANGQIFVTACEDKGRVAISIKDTGVGIEEEKLDYLFQPFNRLGAEASDIEGSGIGLTITQHLVEMMDGDISVNSKPGEGAEFIVSLQAGEKVEETECYVTGSSLSLATDIKPFTVFYIEKDRTNFMVVESILSRWSEVKLVAAEDTQQAILNCHDYSPDFVLMDLSLSGKSGEDTLKQLKQNPETKSVPVVAVSAKASVEDVRKGIDAGFDYYITKPIKLEEILNVIGEITQQQLLV